MNNKIIDDKYNLTAISIIMMMLKLAKSEKKTSENNIMSLCMILFVELFDLTFNFYLKMKFLFLKFKFAIIIIMMMVVIC